MDLIDKGSKARRGHRHPHWYLHAAAGAGAQRPSYDGAVPVHRTDPETGRPVAAGSLASVCEPPPRLREVAVPGWRRWVSQAALAWAAGYGALRIYWALGTAPSPPPIGADLVAFTGWWPVALCGAAVVVVLGRRRARWRRPLAVAAWGVTAALVAASALLLLDVVGILHYDSKIVVQKAPGVSTAAALAAVRPVAARYSGTSVLDQAAFKAALAKPYNQLLMLVYALLALAILIALLGIGNTLALSIYERTRELGVMRAVGMTRRQLRASIRWESAIIAL
jgi:hypothetical protein